MKKTLILIAVINLFSCTQKDANSTKPAEKSMAQIVDALESSGKYPVLDRTDTLAGVDADKNGIRDDIDLYISKQEYSEKQKKAAQQKARVSHKVMTIDLKDKKAVAKLQDEFNRASACLFQMSYGQDGEISGPSVAVEIANLYANTKKRVKARMAFNHTFDGTTFSPDDYVDPCDD